ncbi:MAG: type II toxin-antitoxin system YafQ family toxin, partial [Helicobacter sp.]|nr:type II toxin-antitoxin system YafQ family toxin [Helicobacter sp.]
HNHTLKGNLKGFSECHIKPNLLLVYAKYDETLELNMLRVGSHSKILGS